MKTYFYRCKPIFIDMILDEYETTTHLKIHDNLQKLAAFEYV